MALSQPFVKRAPRAQSQLEQVEQLLSGGEPDEEVLLEEARDRVSEMPNPREMRGEIVAALSFVVAAAALIALFPAHGSPSTLAFIGFVATYALASQIRFEVGTGWTVPTQLVLVPMLLLLPPAYVPLMVAAGNLLGDLPAFITRRRHPARAVFAFGDAWYAIAPALVIALLAPGAPDAGLWPVYALALASQIALDCVVTIVREWYELGVWPLRQLEGYAWIAAVDALLAPIGLLAALAVFDDERLALLLIPMLGLLLLFAKERQNRIDSAIKLRNAYLGTSVMLADLLEGDDHYTGYHSRSVVSLSTSVADALGLDRRRRRLVEFSALLHDIGKIAISKEIINKPGPLDAEEWSLMRTHTVEGQRMLEPVGGVLADVGRIVRASHEHWDGGGYPDGLRTEEIPLEARIVSACDAYNAMTTDRPYRPALEQRDAIDQLNLYAGSQFDPVVTVALVGVIRRAAAQDDSRATPMAVPDLVGTAAPYPRSA